MLSVTIQPLGFSIPDSASNQVAGPRVRPKRFARPPHGIHPLVKYGAVLVGLVLVAVLVQLAVHTFRTEPRDTRAITERELRLNTLAPNEHVYRMVAVFQRPALDYFRATHGLLVLTNRRLLYLGLQPGDLLAGSDAPPTFEERDFPIDTLVRLHPGRTFFWIAKAIVIDTPQGEFVFGVSGASWPRADLLLHAVQSRHDKLYAEGARQKQLRLRAAAERQAAEVEARKAKYYTVQRGDALSTIASQWNTTPDKIREWNHIAGTTIKVGQTLLVRPAS